jgi:hypothetical protein
VSGTRASGPCSELREGGRGAGGGHGPGGGPVRPGRGGPRPPPPSLALPPPCVSGVSACSWARAGSPSPPPGLGRALLSALLSRETLCARAWSRLLGGARRSPRGPLLVHPVTITGSGQSSFFKTVLPQISASRLGRVEASEPGKVSVENSRFWSSSEMSAAGCGGDSGLREFLQVRG